MQTTTCGAGLVSLVLAYAPMLARAEVPALTFEGVPWNGKRSATIAGREVEVPFESRWNIAVSLGGAIATGTVEVGLEGIIGLLPSAVTDAVRGRLPNDNCASYSPHNVVASLTGVTATPVGDSIEVVAYGHAALWTCVQNPTPRCEVRWRGFESKVHCWDGAPIKTVVRETSWRVLVRARLVLEEGRLMLRTSQPDVTIEDELARAVAHIVTGNDLERMVQDRLAAVVSKDVVVPIPSAWSEAGARVESVGLSGGKAQLVVRVETTPAKAVDFARAAGPSN